MEPEDGDFQHASPEEVLREMRSDPNQGLTEEEAKRRLEIYGFNEVPEHRVSPWLSFARKFWGLTAWMLEAVIVLSLALHKYLDAGIVGGLLVFNALVSFWQERRASEAVEALKEKLQVSARVLRNSRWQSIPAKELVPGDIVHLRIGDFVPADVKLLRGEVEVDQSVLTGESLSVSCTTSDVVFCGSIIKRGEADGVVILTGARTYFGRTVELVQIAHPKFHSEEVTGQVVRYLLALVGIALGATLIVAWVLNFSPWEVLPLALVLLASSIPVALPAMFTITMSLGALGLAHRGVLVTRLGAVEDAATMDILCVDKTGTITQNTLSLVEIFPLGGHTKEEVLRWAVLVSDRASLDPIDSAILSVSMQSVGFEAFQRVNFVPFDPQRRRADAVVEHNGRRFLVTKGAVDTIAALAHGDPMLWQERVKFYATKGYRTLAVAVGEEGGPLELVGLLAFYDPPRPDVSKLVQELQSLGLTLKMLTGDAQPIAQEIARQVGLGDKIISASTFREKWRSNPKEATALVEESVGIAEVYPEDKYNIVKGLQLRGHRVGMTGDGVNDAPALRQAEVGIAVSNATDVAKAAASVVLTGPSLNSIVDLVKTGRQIHQRILTWVLNKIIKTFQIVFFVVIAFFWTGHFVVSTFEMVLLLFFVDFVTLALATDNARGSRNPSTWKVRDTVKISAILGLMVVGESLFLLWLGQKHLGGDYAMLRTYSLAILFYMQLFMVFVVREREWFWSSVPGRLLILTVLVDLVVVTLLMAWGIPGVLNPLPLPLLLELLGLIAGFSLVVNDLPKCALLRKQFLGV